MKSQDEFLESHKHQPGNKHHPATGIILVIAGLILLAGNLGLIPSPIWDVIYRWPSIFAIISIVHLIKKDFVPTLIFAALWGFFVLPDIIPSFTFKEIWKFWPVLIILAGLLFLKSHNKKSKPCWTKNTSGTSEDIIEEVSIFSGNIRRIESQNFKGGEIISIFGGSELFFNNSELSSEGAVIELVNIFGGTKLLVPRDWNVKTDVVSILGGFADKRVYYPDNAPKEKTLTITGVTIFGGGEITNY